MDVALLGTGGTIPLPGRRLASAAVRLGSALLLIDCGEGTQVALRELGWGLRRLSHILITHTHADHVLGLPGLLLTLAFTGKGADEPLTVYGPEPLVPLMGHLRAVAPRLPYPVEVRPLAAGEALCMAGTELELTCAPGRHDVPCLAYRLHLPRAPRFDPDAAADLGVPITSWGRLQRGEAVQLPNRTVLPEQVMGDARRGISLAYVTDTLPSPELVQLVAAEGEGSDLLIAEGMYGGDEQRPVRWESEHMSFAEAAALARDGRARRLWLTHYSPQLTSPEEYVEAARAVFSEAQTGRDGMRTTLSFED